MYSFLTTIVMVAALAAMIYLLARALPRISDAEHANSANASSFDKMLDKLPMEKMDGAISSFFEKLLRKSKLIVLKIDNLLNNYLDQVKKHSPARKEQHGAVLKEKMEAMVEKNDKSQ